MTDPTSGGDPTKGGTQNGAGPGNGRQLQGGGGTAEIEMVRVSVEPPEETRVAAKPPAETRVIDVKTADDDSLEMDGKTTFFLKANIKKNAPFVYSIRTNNVSNPKYNP